MKKEKRKIQLKKDQPKKIEILVGNRRIKAVRGKAVTVPLEDLGVWLRTGRFEIVDETAKPEEKKTEKKTDKKSDGGNS
ncbi:MAG TPA: hypothetical protein VMM38_01270 [Aridibacter sp.]|nr:hypothetical protein [Aridibacter sp.]